MEGTTAREKASEYLILTEDINNDVLVLATIVVVNRTKTSARSEGEALCFGSRIELRH